MSPVNQPNELVAGLVSEFAADPKAAFSTPVAKLLAKLREDNPELSDDEYDQVREGWFEAIIEEIKARHPNWTLFVCPLADCPDELYVGRKASWFEYKTTMKKSKGEGAAADADVRANEDIFKHFLVYPRPEHELMNDMDCGKLVTIAGFITKGLGFSEVGAVKKV